jgi:phosphoglycerate kinase
VQPGDKIVDIGPDSFAEIARVIRGAKFVLWNGPTGLYEAGYSEWTEAVAQAIAGSGAHTIVGGGDTVATIAHLGIEEKYTFLSTAGGALLEYLINGTLPGIEALE